ncbi:MAG: OB-fold nucleic acid binding domain-containing protein [Bacteroidota bacterium]
MVKNLFYILISLIVFSSCNMGTKKADVDHSKDTIKMAVLTFDQKADSFVNRTVVIEGTVLHTCKHGGKRMFLVDGTDSIRVEITAGENITKFDEALLGSKVRVWGKLMDDRIDAKYLNEWEAEVKKPVENHNVGVHTGAKGHEDMDKQDKLDQIASLRNDLKNSGKDHLSFFSIEASKFIELK